MSNTDLISHTEEWKALQQHVGEIQLTHLRTLLQDKERVASFVREFDGCFLDFTRQRATKTTLELLLALAKKADVQHKIQQMRNGEKINVTENRAVLHMALRASKEDEFLADGKNVVGDVHEVLDKINAFSKKVRSGEHKGATGKPLKNVIAVGIGGSYLGAEFVAEALATEPKAEAQAEGRILRFLANVDPIDVTRATRGLDPEETLVVIISKTFTTAETMLNARTLRKWITDKLGEDATSKHMIACSTSIDKVKAFGISPDNIFAFWDWVGGRYSVTSAVGLVPIALQYGFDVVEDFLAGARSMDKHYTTAPLDQNLPVLLGLFGVWNSSFLKSGSRAIAGYCQALLRMAAHIQQLDMESNGKRVTKDGKPLDFDAGEVNFGEPGTNGQHSFYQLFHQGRVVPVDFIGFVKSQQPRLLPNEEVSNHDELMSNFFAQPDALAEGRISDEIKDDPAVVPHKVMPGNRPSNVLLLPVLNAYTVGQLLSLYEHRTATQGFVWGINSFDQMGVELGKVLAKQVRNQLSSSRSDPKAAIKGFNPSTTALLKRYLSQ